MTSLHQRHHGRLYVQNLAALRAFQPDLAETIESVPIPDSALAATGRDGSATFLVRDRKGRETWLGRSSMPRISAEALSSALRHDAGSAWLPGVLTGAEPLVVTERIPRHSAVFVLEDDPLAIKLAFHVHDYVACIAAGRIVFLSIADLDASLERFLIRYPGYVLPSLLLTAPQVSAARTSELRRKIEHASKMAAAWQGRELESVACSIRNHQHRAMPSRPTVAVLGVSPSATAIEQTARIARGLSRLGLACHPCAPDAPGRCHPLAHLRRIERSGADCVFVVGDGARWLRPLLPPEIPIATFSALGEATVTIQPDEIGPADVLLAPSRHMQEQWQAAGIDPEQVRLVPPAADDGLAMAGLPREQQESEPTCDTAFLMDLPAADARACGIGLASHVALWQALHEVAAVRAKVGAVPRPDVWLAEASRRTGVELHDTGVREMFLSWMRDRLAPAVVRRAAVLAATEAGRRVGVWGQGWEAAPELPVTTMGHLPIGPLLRQVLASARLVVLPDLSDRSVQLALDALCVETDVVCWGHRAEFIEQYHGLESAAPMIRFCAGAEELSRCLQACGLDGAVERRRREEAAMLIRSEHSTSHRISGMMKRLRDQQRAYLTHSASLTAGEAPVSS